ncbi:MAG TPA: ABC transporter permease subunit [Gaiellaceae bacterium]
MTAGAVTAEPQPTAAPPAPGGSGRLGRYATGALFLGPALILMGVWMVYPAIYTIARSFYGKSGFDDFVGFDNYKTLFTTPTLTTAIKNNAIWVAVVPAFVTAIGLMYAVLTERVRWAVAFKTVVFVPMAISAFATGVTWRLMDQQDPTQGTVNAVLRVFVDAVHPPGVLPSASPSTPNLVSKGGALVLTTPLHPGGVAKMGLTAIAPQDVPSNAQQAVQPKPAQGTIGGVVWRDFKPGGGKVGVVEQGEDGLPGVTVQLRGADGNALKKTTTDDHGTFSFAQLPQGTYQTAIGSQTFRQPWAGIAWLDSKLITPALLIAYIWIWAGFSMVVIAAGLSAMPRDVLEAARTDGASEWQVFRRVTVPLLAPVLSVVFITMIINVLKVFDLVVSLAPESVQPDANVIALAMWRTSFGGVNDFGVGSAIAVFLFLLVIPVLALNIKRFRSESQ